MAEQEYWSDFWSSKSKSSTDFQATGRGSMDIVSFLYTVNECIIRLKLSKNDKLLDIGCGTGIFSLALSQHINEIFAIDLSEGVIERAKSNLSDVDNIHVSLGTITDIPLESLSIDKVLGYSILQYLHDKAALKTALIELYRVMKKGGVALLAANPDICKKDLYLDTVTNNDPVRREEENILQSKVLWFEKNDLINICEDNGFDAKVYKIHNRIWQSFYMFDLLLVKND